MLELNDWCVMSYHEVSMAESFDSTLEQSVTSLFDVVPQVVAMLIAFEGLSPPRLAALSMVGVVVRDAHLRILFMTTLLAFQPRAGKRCM